MRQNKRRTLTPQQAAVQRRQQALTATLRGISPSGRLGSVVWGGARRTRMGSYINNTWPNLATQKIPYTLSFDPVWGAQVGPAQLSGLGDTVDTAAPDTSVNLTPYPITPTSITTYPGQDGTLTVTSYLLPNTGPGGISIGNQPPPQQPKQPGFLDQLSAFFSKPVSAGSSITMGHLTAGGAFLIALAGVSKGKR